MQLLSEPKVLLQGLGGSHGNCVHPDAIPEKLLRRFSRLQPTGLVWVGWWATLEVRETFSILPTELRS